MSEVPSEYPDCRGFGLKMFSAGLTGWMFGPDGRATTATSYEEDQWYEAPKDRPGFAVLEPDPEWVSSVPIGTLEVMFGSGCLFRPGDTVRRVEWRGLRTKGTWNEFRAITVDAIRILLEDNSMVQRNLVPQYSLPCDPQ